MRLGIAHVPDGRGTFVDLTVEENLRLGAYVRRDRAAVAADFERIYGYFPRLQERRRQQAGTLSGGEQQMLAISRALMLRPRLLLLDEPSFGLAPLIVREIFAHPARHQPSEKASASCWSSRTRRWRWTWPTTPICSRPAAWCSPAPRPSIRAQRRRAPRVSRLLSGPARWTPFLHQVFSGLATGGIYACVALALVMIYQATAPREFRPGRDGDVLAPTSPGR